MSVSFIEMAYDIEKAKTFKKKSAYLRWDDKLRDFISNTYYGTAKNHWLRTDAYLGIDTQEFTNLITSDNKTPLLQQLICKTVII